MGVPNQGVVALQGGSGFVECPGEHIPDGLRKAVERRAFAGFAVEVDRHTGDQFCRDAAGVLYL